MVVVKDSEFRSSGVSRFRPHQSVFRLSVRFSVGAVGADVDTEFHDSIVEFISSVIYFLFKEG